MSYILSDTKKLYRSGMIRIMLISLAVIMIADPISVYFINSRYIGFFEEFGANPFQFWLLMNSSGWGNTVYNTLFWVFPVISTGLIFYTERHSSVYELLISRRNKKVYFMSKIISGFMVTFINFLLLLTLNVLITYMVYSADAPITEQYNYIIPYPGMFSYSLYQSEPLLMVFVYIILNALAIALLSWIVLAVHMIFNFRNNYLAFLVPFILLYVMNYFSSLVLANHWNYDLGIIVQPRAASALVVDIRGQDIIIVFLALTLIGLMALLAGYIRNREAI